MILATLSHEGGLTVFRRYDTQQKQGLTDEMIIGVEGEVIEVQPEDLQTFRERPYTYPFRDRQPANWREVDGKEYRKRN